MTIEDTLAERGDRYGSFQNHANIAQALQDVMRSEDGWERLAADQRQALTVIADKIARMLNGDPTYRDNWHDIVGYAKLVDDRMAKDENPTPMAPVCQAPISAADHQRLMDRRAWLEGCLSKDADGIVRGWTGNDWHHHGMPMNVRYRETWRAYQDGTVLAPGEHGRPDVAVAWALP